MERALWLFVLLGILRHQALALGKRSDDLDGTVSAVVAAQAQKLTALEADLQAAKNTITANQNTITTLRKAMGSSFVRWGKSECPSGSTLLYSGVAGGSHNHQPGGGANRLCLTTQPVFDNTPLESVYSQIQGAQYYIPGHHYTDVLCAVCRTQHSLTYMVPGTNRCPQGSAEQYHGHLTAGDHNNEAPSEYLCLDASPEDRMGSQDPKDSCYFEHVRTHCGSLPCPPYTEAKVVTCVVCSV